MPPIRQILSSLARPAAGAVAGGTAGYYGTPYIGGYEDVPKARRLSAYSDALLGAILGGAANRAGGFKNLGGQFRGLPLKQQAGIGGGVAGAELIPILAATQHKAQGTADTLSGAANNLADSAKVTSIPFNIQKALQSSTGRGAGVGAGVAGIGALLTGLGRQRTEREIGQSSTRGGMVGSDLLKYIIPAMVAGGVAGSMRKDKPLT